jgi:hypothetical protein
VIDKQLKLAKNDAGDERWVCGHCGRPADSGESVHNDHIVLILMCPSGQVTLGEWATMEEKNLQLADYKKRLTSKA